MTAYNFTIQRVAVTEPLGSITVQGSGSPRKAGSVMEPRNGYVETSLTRGYDGFAIDPAIQRNVYKNTDRVIPYSLHNLFLIKYV